MPECGDAVTMQNEDFTKRSYAERQYLKVLMECLQFLARQGLALRGNEDLNDNLTQLMVLRGKNC